MRIKVSYIWDSENNTYHPDEGDGKYDAEVTPSVDDRMTWAYARKGTTLIKRGKATNAVASGTMPLTRGFEILPYLAGLARDVVNILGG